MLKSLLIVLTLVFATLIVGGMFLSNTYHVERSVLILTDKAAIYPQIATLKNWPEWTVWTKEADPSVQFVFEGSEVGKGASMRWDGDKEKMGSGELHLLEADPEHGVDYELTFNHGEYKSTGSLKLEAGSSGTRVLWTNDGTFGAKPIGGWVGLAFSSMMDDRMGGDFQKGLDKLKSRVEAAKK